MKSSEVGSLPDTKGYLIPYIVVEDATFDKLFVQYFPNHTKIIRKEAIGICVWDNESFTFALIGSNPDFRAFAEWVKHKSTRSTAFILRKSFNHQHLYKCECGATCP